ncbi:MAG TPA: xanthine dehydrogenase family protein subunit M [Dehalococcoidia bacterium]|jgi:carbon-monoxide dehydrogenase medium subunit|nr:xanthine dehydrogenase family protein subunit M [Dehalococcoidia bacterium]
MRRFDYYRASSVDQAISLLDEHGEGGMLLAGGTDLLVQIKEAGLNPGYIVSLLEVDELQGLRTNRSGLRIGARTLMREVAGDAGVQSDYSALADGAGLVGSWQTRNMGTVGGNVANAAPSADTGPPLSVLGATVHIAGAGGTREVAIDDFWTGPGQTVLGASEVLTQITVTAPPANSGSFYERHTPRQIMDIAAVGTAVYVELDGDDNCTTARIALGAVAPTVMRAPNAEAAIAGGPIGEQTAAAAGAAAAAEATPISDQRGSAEFRRHLVEVMTTRSILRAAERAQG